MVKVEQLAGGTKKIEDRALILHSGNAPDLRLMGDTGFFPTEKNKKSEIDLYQHEDGFAILIQRGKFEVTEYKNGKITLKKRS